ncbi:MAG: S24 family peptidase, partial [Burkholderiaceae bacterium]
EVRNGQIVVARIGDEVTVKRWRRQGTQVQLLPENPEFEPILLDARHDQFALEGLGVGLLRAGRGL